MDRWTVTADDRWPTERNDRRSATVVIDFVERVTLDTTHQWRSHCHAAYVTTVSDRVTERGLTMILFAMLACLKTRFPLPVIWRHCRVPPPRFPKRRENFGDSHTFKADNYTVGLLIFAWIFRTYWGFWSQKGRCDVMLTRPQRTHSYSGGFLRLYQLW